MYLCNLFQSKGGFAPADVLDQNSPITEQPGLPGAVDEAIKKAGTDAATSAITSQVNSFMADFKR